MTDENKGLVVAVFVIGVVMAGIGAGMVLGPGGPLLVSGGCCLYLALHALTHC